MLCSECFYALECFIGSISRVNYLLMTKVASCTLKFFAVSRGFAVLKWVVQSAKAA